MPAAKRRAKLYRRINTAVLAQDKREAFRSMWRLLRMTRYTFVMRIFLLCFMFLLTACGPSGISVFDETGARVGRVTVENDDRARIFDSAGSRIGKVIEDRVFNTVGSRVGRITSDDRILNAAGTRIGRVSGETRCLDNTGSNVGRIGTDIDDEAAGGACLLLLLAP